MPGDELQRFEEGNSPSLDSDALRMVLFEDACPPKFLPPANDHANAENAKSIGNESNDHELLEVAFQDEAPSPNRQAIELFESSSDRRISSTERLARLRRSVEMFSRLDPPNIQYEARANLELGQMLISDRDGEAVVRLERSIELFTTLGEARLDFGSNAHNRYHLGRACFSLGEIYSRFNMRRVANVYFQQAQQALVRACELAPSNLDSSHVFLAEQFIYRFNNRARPNVRTRTLGGDEIIIEDPNAVRARQLRQAVDAARTRIDRIMGRS